MTSNNQQAQAIASTTEHACDLCGVDDAIEVPHCREYTDDQPIHICSGCGFVYVRARRSAEAIADSWSNDIYGDGYTAFLPAVRARHAFVAHFINETIGLEGRCVVDIGAGEGAFLAMLKELAADLEPFGIEPSSQNVAGMRAQGIPCFEGTIEAFTAAELDTGPHPDIITILWTLENCNSWETMLRSAWNLLETGGHIVVATGSRLLVPFKKPLDRYLGPRPADTHCFRFSANTLRSALRKTGFEIERHNRYEDNDVLCIVARKATDAPQEQLSGDDPATVREFFERWHQDTVWHRAHTTEA